MSTTVTNLEHDVWADLGPTPCFIQAIDDEPVTFVIDTSAPTSPDLVAHLIGAHIGDSMADIGLDGGRVFARGLSRAAVVVVSR